MKHVAKQIIYLEQGERQQLCDIGATIKLTRVSHGLSRQKASEHAGITPTGYGKIETGALDPGVILLLRLRELFRRPISYLVNDAPEPEALGDTDTHRVVQMRAKMDDASLEQWIKMGEFLLEQSQE